MSVHLSLVFPSKNPPPCTLAKRTLITFCRKMVREVCPEVRAVRRKARVLSLSCSCVLGSHSCKLSLPSLIDYSHGKRRDLTVFVNWCSVNDTWSENCMLDVVFLVSICPRVFTSTVQPWCFSLHTYVTISDLDFISDKSILTSFMYLSLLTLNWFQMDSIL
jgi:hypothetical protein